MLIEKMQTQQKEYNMTPFIGNPEITILIYGDRKHVPRQGLIGKKHEGIFDDGYALYFGCVGRYNTFCIHLLKFEHTHKTIQICQKSLHHKVKIGVY